MDQPVVLTTKTLLVFLLATAIISGGVAVAAAQLSQPDSAGAQARATGETRELSKLNRGVTKANRTLTDIKKALSGPLNIAAPSLTQNTRDTADNLQKLCQAVAEFPSDC
jgi:hypothetical protein